MSQIPTNGPWKRSQIEAYLREARIPIRLAFRARDGLPRLVSLWFIHEDARLWCAVQRDSFTARCLEHDGRCAFEVSGENPPYMGVRGKGVAHLVAAEGERILRRCMEKYLGSRDDRLRQWLLRRAATEVAIRIEPRTLHTWDYRDRMTAP